MADINHIARLINGITRNIDIAASGNALIVNVLKVGTTGSNSSLSKAILDNLIALQNGSDFADGTNAHTHDGRYYTESELTARTTDAAGASLLAVERKTYTNISGYSSLLADTLANYNIQALLEAIDTTLGSAAASEFSDAVFRITDDGDSTKKIAFQASGITTGTTRTITMPDANVNLADVNNAVLVDGSRAFTADQSMGGNQLNNLGYATLSHEAVRRDQIVGRDDGSSDYSATSKKITNVADPTSAQDAATKAYVDAVANGLKPKESVRAASTANVAIATGLENGDIIDGVTLATGDRVLLKDQSIASENGIYVVVASGAASRSADFDSLTPIDEINGAWVSVQEGTANAGKVYVQYGTVSTLGTDAINFTYWDPIATITGGDMITKSGNDLSVDLASAGGLESTNPGNAAGQLQVKVDATGGANLAKAVNRSSNGLAVKVDDSTIEGDATTGQLRVKDSGISTAKIANDAVDKTKINADIAGLGLSQAVGGELDVNVDDSTIEIATDTLRVKDAGITEAKLAASVAGAGLAGGAGFALSVNVDNTSIEISADTLQVKATGIAKVFVTLTNNTGVQINAGSVVALSQSVAGEIFLADADALATCEAVVGVAAENIANTASGKVQIAGRIAPTQDANYDLGKRVYVSQTAGSSTKTAPSAANSVIFLLGHAVSLTEVILNPHLEAVND